MPPYYLLLSFLSGLYIFEVGNFNHLIVNRNKRYSTNINAKEVQAYLVKCFLMADLVLPV